MAPPLLTDVLRERAASQDEVATRAVDRTAQTHGPVVEKTAVGKRHAISGDLDGAADVHNRVVLKHAIRETRLSTAAADGCPAGPQANILPERTIGDMRAAAGIVHAVPRRSLNDESIQYGP